MDEPSYMAALEAMRKAAHDAAWHVSQCRQHDLVWRPDAERLLATLMTCVVKWEMALGLHEGKEVAL